jgi:hypothetical protein
MTKRDPASHDRPHGPDGRFVPTGRPPADESQEPNQIARRARRRAAAPANPKPREFDAQGRFVKGTSSKSINGGRKKGAKDILPRGSVKAVLQQLIAEGHGHEKLYEAIDAGIQAKPDTAIKYLDLAARVLDKADDTQGRVVHFHLHTNVDIYALGKAREQHGLPPIAQRVESNRDSEQPAGG